MSGPRCEFPLLAERRFGLTADLDISQLEHKVEELEARVRRLSVDSAEPNDLQISLIEANDQDLSSSSLSENDFASLSRSHKRNSFQTVSSSSSDNLSESLIDTLPLGHEHKGHEGLSTYRGRTTGVEITGSLRHLCDTFMGPGINFSSPALNMVNALDSQASFESLPMVSGAGSFFPLGPEIHKWIDLAFEESFILWPFLDRHSFTTRVQRLLQSGMSDEGGCVKDDIGLLHSIIALGQRHDSSLIILEGKRDQSMETRG